VDIGRRPVSRSETSRANRGWWDGAADEYQAEHGGFLRDDGFIWCPEGLDEADARLLGEVAGRRILEVGCGAGQCARWLAGQGATIVGIDLSYRQLQHSRRIDLSRDATVPARQAGGATAPAVPAVVPVAQADAEVLPFLDGSFDLVCSAFGALPFVADAGAVLAEVRRVLRPGGRFVFSVSHPIRWAFPDDPGPRGLTADRPYFDRSPYVEFDDGTPSYVEHHRTMGDWVGLIASSGLALTGLVEPEWPDGHDETWGGWSPLRGRLLPGTAIFQCLRP
jgi:SAM-dependent methyltransferase